MTTTTGTEGDVSTLPTTTTTGTGASATGTGTGTQTSGATTTSMDESSTDSRRKPDFAIGTVVHGKWHILSELGRGGCGVVYCVERLEHLDSTRPKAALKAELVSKNYSETLAAEANVLRKLQWSRHVCQLFSAGRIENNINVVCMGLAGPSLSALRRRCPQQRMSFSTALRVCFHCLNAIEDMHCIGFIHRDIKGSNFAIGYYTSEIRTIRILDFGFARAYLSWTKQGTLQIRRPRKRAPFLGTDRYCSINVHRRAEQGRVDDCWSWLFMLVELMYGKLPWRDVPDKQIVTAKENALPMLFKHGPVEMYAAIDHLTSLTYASRPDYDMLRGLITTVCKTRGFRFNDSYDWEMSVGGKEATVAEEREVQLDQSTTTAQSPRSYSPAAEKFGKHQDACETLVDVPTTEVVLRAKSAEDASTDKVVVMNVANKPDQNDDDFMDATDQQ